MRDLSCDINCKTSRSNQPPNWDYSHIFLPRHLNFSSFQSQCYDERKPSPGDPVPTPGGGEQMSAGQWVLVVNAMLAYTHCSCCISLSLRTLSSPLHLCWDFCQVHYTEDSLVDLKIGSPMSLVAIFLQL